MAPHGVFRGDQERTCVPTLKRVPGMLSGHGFAVTWAVPAPPSGVEGESGHQSDVPWGLCLWTVRGEEEEENEKHSADSSLNARAVMCSVLAVEVYG